MTTRPSAILLFARSAHLDARYKGLSGGEAFIDELTAQTKLKARRTGLPVFHFDERSQVGSTFGERLGNAIQAVYDHGIEHLVIIGNDSPDLRPEVLKGTLGLIEEGKTVFGPTTDGGTYLIGISREYFDLETFKSLPWQENNLLEALLHWNLSLGGRSEVLAPLMDLDDAEACRNWHMPSRFLSSRLYQLLLSFQSAKPLLNTLWRNPDFDIHRCIPFNKGSPLSCIFPF